MKVLFWNICKKSNFFDTIANIVIEENVDILALAEFPKEKGANRNSLIEKIAAKGKVFSYLEPVVANEKVELFYRDDRVTIHNKKDNGRFHAKEVIGNDELPYTLVFCHMKSKFGSDDFELDSDANEFCTALREYETHDAKHKRTIVCGDFNVEPFSPTMVNAQNFHATMNIHIANNEYRKIRSKSYDYFYNPMWNLLGDGMIGKPSGSYYHKTNDFHQYFWKMIDQVIIRPDVIDKFNLDELKVLSGGDSFNLINDKHQIDSINYSDHLPITFTLNI